MNEKNFVQVCKIGDLEEGKGKVFDIDGRRVAVFKVRGELYAIDDYCTHAEASLAEGFVDGTVVECPWHGARFDLKTGAALSMPATRPVHTFEIKVENDYVFVGRAPRQ